MCRQLPHTLRIRQRVSKKAICGQSRTVLRTMTRQHVWTRPWRVDRSAADAECAKKLWKKHVPYKAHKLPCRAWWCSTPSLAGQLLLSSLYLFQRKNVPMIMLNLVLDFKFNAFEYPSITTAVTMRDCTKWSGQCSQHEDAHGQDYSLRCIDQLILSAHPV